MNGYSRTKYVILLVVSSLIVFGLMGDGVPAGLGDKKPKKLRYLDLYSKTSPFKTKIAANPIIDPNSAAMVGTLVTDKKRQGFFIGVKKWTVPIYYARANTPRRTVRLTANWASATLMKNVPMPDYVRPDPEDDAEMVVIDPKTGVEYDFWQAKKKSGRWTAGWANAIDYQGTGIFPKGNSARGSGFALPAGMIWPHELKAGQIKHALVFSYTWPKSGGPIEPATESDGRSNRNGAIPEGARIQLDPSLDLDSLNLTSYERTIAKALQDYGMICGDNGGGVQLYAVHPMSAKSNPYKGILPNRIYVYLPHIPVNRFRVLKMSAQTPDPEIELIPVITSPNLSTDSSKKTAFKVIWSNFPSSSWPEINSFQVQKKTGPKGVWRTWKRTGRKTYAKFKGKAGHTYYFRVRTRLKGDGFGSWSAIRKTVMPYDQNITGGRYRGKWKYYRRLNSPFYRGTVKYSTSPGASFSYRFRGKQIFLISGKAGNRGKATVYIDGKYKRKIDTYSSTRRYRQMVYKYPKKPYSSNQTHTIRIKILHRKRGASSGYRFDIDGVGVLR